MTLVADVFPEVMAPKNMLRKMSKKPCFRGPLDRQQRKWVENTVALWMAEPLQYFLITVKVVALEKVCFSDKQNPKALCWHIDSQWQTLSA